MGTVADASTPVGGRRSEAIDVGRLIDEGPISRLQLRLFALCILVAVLDGIDTQSIGVAAAGIATELAIPLSHFGPVFSAMLLGATIGAVLFGSLADRLGRKRLMVLATFIFAVFTLLTAVVQSLDTLIVVRFLAGMGLGGATPCFLALGSEYAPKRRRQTITALLFAGFPLGAMIGGFLNAFILARYSWHMLFFVGGAAPVVVTVLLALWLPESVSFLIARGATSSKIEAILRKLAPGLAISPDTGFIMSGEPAEPSEAVQVAPLRRLFTDGRAITTIMLWIMFFLVFGVLTIVALWTPGLLRQAGMPTPDTAKVVGFNGMGALFGMAIGGRLVERFGPVAALAPALLLGAVSVAALGGVGAAFLPAAVLMVLAGFFVGVAGAGIIALAAMIYPVVARSTGIGWAMGIGRFGQFVGPLVIGALVAAQWSMASMFQAVGVTPVLAALCLFLLRRPRVADAPAATYPPAAVQPLAET